MMSVTLLLLLAFVTSTLYGLESTREHFLQLVWPKNNSGYFPTGNLEDRVALLEKALSEGLQKLQNELDQQRAKNDILQALLEQQDTRLKDQDTSIKELEESISKLRETTSIQTGKIKQLEELTMKRKEANISINDRNTEMYRNETAKQVSERANKFRQLIRNEKESRIETPYVLDVKRETNTKIKKEGQVGRIAFYATVSVFDLINLGVHHTIVFDDVVTNVGMAYNANTGIFIAPVNGIYFFSVTAIPLQDKGEHLELVKNGIPVNDILLDPTGTNRYTSVTRAFVLEVGQGGEIWVRSVSAGGIHGSHYTTICGWLLFPI